MRVSYASSIAATVLFLAFLDIGATALNNDCSKQVIAPEDLLRLEQKRAQA